RLDYLYLYDKMKRGAKEAPASHRTRRETRAGLQMPARARLPMGRDRAKATARIPFGREVVTFSCGYWPGGVLPSRALNGGTNMTFLKTREPAQVETSAGTEGEGGIRESV